MTYTSQNVKLRVMTLYLVFVLVSIVLFIMTLVGRGDNRVELRDDDHLHIERKHLNKALKKGFSTTRGDKHSPRYDSMGLSKKDRGVYDETNAGR